MRLKPPTLTRYQLRVLEAVPETPIAKDTLAVKMHGWCYPGLRRALEHLERCGLIAVTPELDLRRTADGTAALTEHVKAEKQKGLF